jgi:hypothetical protein
LRPMARKIKKLKSPLPNGPSGEIGAADALTIGWMLSVLTTLVCEAGVLAAYWYAAKHPDAPKATAFFVLLLFAAAAIGLFSLCLLPIVVKLRGEIPPLPIVIFSVVVGLAPVGLALWLR